MNRTNPCQEYKGDKFLLACKNSKTNNWLVTPRRFILQNPEPKKLIGQFITSNWWKLQCNLNSNITLIIIKVTADKSISEIEKDINNIDHEFYTCDIISYIKKSWYFNLDGKIINTIINKITEDYCAEFRSNNAVLKLKIVSEKDKNCIYLMTPSFSINPL